jgi:class 3 adenylate cyclase
MDKHFEDLLIEYARADTDEARKKIEETLWREFGATRAVLIMDMSGFSLLTQRYGIIHYLSMVKRMQITAKPIIEQHGGEVVKFEADNCFAEFPDVHQAVSAGLAMNAAFFGMNIMTPDESDIRISIGIDYGNILLIGGPDYFGDAVNLASKLGEDIAEPGEILITERAYARIPEGAGIKGRKITLTVSGVKIKAHKVIYKHSCRSNP